jgi:hypothetical protein
VLLLLEGTRIAADDGDEVVGASLVSAEPTPLAHPPPWPVERWAGIHAEGAATVGVCAIRLRFRLIPA